MLGVGGRIMSEPLNAAAVLRYYDQTRWDYKHLWKSDSTLGIHFGYYDGLAPTHRLAVQRMNEVLASAAAIDASDVVLDAGCGLGGSAIWLAAALGCSVLGINIVPYQLQLARQAAASRNLGHLAQFDARDYADTGLPAASFSVVWALESVVHAPSKEAFAREAYRLLRPGGRLVLAEYMARGNPQLTADEAEIFTPWLQGWAMPGLMTEQGYRTALHDAGFLTASVTDMTVNVRPSLARLDRITRSLLPFAPAARRCRLITQGQLENARASAAQVKALKLGLWSYKLVVARRGDAPISAEDASRIRKGGRIPRHEMGR
jgi:tocopherol O-methyltransferase